VHKYHEQAEELATEVISYMRRFLPHEGEDISYYNPCAVDEAIQKLIRIRTLLACANVAEGRE
jgi:hypothetical protein